jgi:alkylation response protein AidB-like acyl-CoA dehydrogenase
VDVRFSPEQLALRDSAAQVATRLGPGTVAQLDDAERAAKLEAAVTASGWRELRTPNEDGAAWASAVEVAVVAEELARGLADVAFLGPTLAAELRRLAGAPVAAEGETAVLASDLSQPAVATDGLLPTGAVAIDAGAAASALVLLPAPDGHRLGKVPVPPGATWCEVDLTRPSARWVSPAPVTPVPGQSRALDEDDVAAWKCLGLAITCADLVGVMRGALELATEYARTRRQYGAAIGSFQAVQHLLADSLVMLEGSRSVALHAAWAVDALAPADALTAASAAKAYCARAARTVCETSVQVHGGIGNTWDCLAHVSLRRALLSGDTLGGVGEGLARVLAAHGVGADDGLR